MTTPFAKIMAAGLTTPLVLMNRNTIFEKIVMNNQRVLNQCDGEKLAPGEEEANNLDKIFDNKEGGMMDQQEVMELMMNQGGKNRLKPFPFEKISNNTAALKHGEVVDGLTVSMMAPLGNQFQMGGDWKFSNRDGASFELMSSINNSTGNPN